MAKNRSNRAWIQRHVTDPYVRMAQQHQYRSRAAYKLIEIDEKDRLIRPGMTIVDLGAAPGSWSQVVREKLVGSGGEIRGKIFALDLLEIEPIAGVDFLQGDFREEDILRELEARLEGRKVDLVISDMAPNMSGIGLVDAARVEHVCELALEFSQQHLTPDGALLVKTFAGSGYSQLVHKFKMVFEIVAPRKPKASRAESSETFLLGRRLKVR